MGRGKKGVRFHKKDNIKVEKNDFPKFTEKDMDDEVDIFHKQRDRVPLDINDGEDASDDELEQPVFDLQGLSSEESKEDSESDDDEELTGLAAKIAKQAKILRQKTGGVDDETEAEEEEVEEEKKALWGKRKHMYYNADNIDYEIQSSDEEMPAEEEAEVLRLQKKRAESFRPEDFGLDDDDLEDEEESETGLDIHETTFQEALNQQEGGQRKKLKQSRKAVIDKGIDDGKPVTFEEIKKDINALSKEQQMEVVMSDAPELVGLLSEFKDALNNLKLVQSLIHKAKEKTSVSKEAMGYLELKQQLILCYCQAIVFYLLLKSEGRPVRDHPVIARLVEIRKLLDRIQPLDSKVKTQVDAILEVKNDMKNAIQTPAEVSMHKSKSKNGKMKLSKSIQDAEDVAKTPSISAEDLEEKPNPNEHKQIKKPLGKESTEMLKEREKLEAYLNDLKHGLSQAVTAKNKSKKLKPENYGNLESIEDFDDEVDDLGPAGSVPKDHLQFLPQKKKLSQLVAESGRAAKRPKLLSGDDNLPEKEDLGDKRRRYETQKINRAVSPGSHVEEKKDNSEESEDEFYKAAKKKRNATLVAKAEKYSWESRIPQPEAEVEGKRHITYQMEKNKGLTPHRKKQTKNPRKKYKLKHQKAVIARKGQVREVKLPQGPYGGETTGIRTAISRSVRFKH